MPNIKSAIKRVKIAEKKTMNNSVIKTKYKTAVKKYETANAEGSKEAEELLSLAKKAIDHASTKGVISKNAASRKKSRLEKKLAVKPVAKKTTTKKAEKKEEVKAEEVKEEAKKETKKASTKSEAKTTAKKTAAKTTTKRYETTTTYCFLGAIHFICVSAGSSTDDATLQPASNFF